MSDEERKRAEVMARVKKKDLGLKMRPRYWGSVIGRRSGCGGGTGSKEPRGWCTAVWAENPIGRSRRSFGIGRCGWCGRSIRGKWESDSGRPWRRSILESEDGIDLCQGKVETSYFRQAAMMGLRPPFPSESIVRNSARRKGFAIAAQEQRAIDGSALFERPI